MAQLQLQVLGGFRLTAEDGQEIEIVGKKPRALLAYLALNPGKAHFREKLASLLWGDRLDEQARHSLRQALGTVRKALNLGAADGLSAEDGTVTLDATMLRTDVAELERLVRENSPQALGVAASHYVAPLLEDFQSGEATFDDWLASERERVGTIAAQALEALASALERQGDTEAAVDATKRLVSLQPTREAAHRRLMTLYAAAGRRADAIRQYQACVEALKRDLDVAPSADTTQLHERIRVDASTTGSSAVADSPDPGALPSVAILPFKNASGDPGEDYLAQGLVLDIATELSRFEGLKVVSGSTMLAYQGVAVSAVQVSKETGARFVVEGNLRRSAGRLRVAAQLIDGRDGSQRWAGRFERAAEDVFAVQEEIAAAVATELQVKLMEGEQARLWRRSTNNPVAYDWLLRAVHARRAYLNDGSLEIATHCAEQAISADPNCALAYALLAVGCRLQLWGPHVRDPVAVLARQRVASARALVLDADLPYANMESGFVAIIDKNFDGGETLLRKAVAVSPEAAEVVSMLGLGLVLCGKPQEALEAIDRGMGLTPRPPVNMHFVKGEALFYLRRFEEAIASLERAPLRGGLAVAVRAYLAASHQALGHGEQAQAFVAQLNEIGYRAGWIWQWRPLRRAEDQKLLMGLLQQAGLPSADSAPPV